MDIAVGLKFVDVAVLEQVNRRLSAPETTILQGSLQGLTYEQMAEISEYSTNYLMRDIGPKFWKLLSDVFGEPISKTNLRVVLKRLIQMQMVETNAHQASNRLDPVSTREIVAESTPQPLFEISSPDASRPLDWVEAPDVSCFVGRTEELALLKQWLLQENCRLLVLQGLSGIGKTTLTRVLVDQIQAEFNCVIWRSLSQAPQLNTLLANLLQALPRASHKHDGNLESQFLASLRSSRCLLILDGAETILQAGRLAGHYRPGYEEYGVWLQDIGQDTHRSCLILTSLENPKDVTRLEGDTSLIRSLPLTGWTDAEAQTFLETEQLIGQTCWSALIERYQGNPAALKQAARIVRSLFNRDVTEFMKQQSFVFGEIGTLLGRSFERLSMLEKEILYWLISEPLPISLAALQRGITWSMHPARLLEVLDSLKQRRLIATVPVNSEPSFILQPLIREYVASQLVEEVSRSTSSGDEQPNALSQVEEPIDLKASPKGDVNLSQWLQHQIDLTWQPIGALLGVHTASFTPRLRGISQLRGEGQVKRFKSIRLGEQSDSPEVALLVAVMAGSDPNIEIRVQIHPLGDSVLLPTNLNLSLLNDSGETLRSVRSQGQDNFIQLPRFRGQPQESFSLQVTLGAIKITEEFII